MADMCDMTDSVSAAEDDMQLRPLSEEIDLLRCELIREVKSRCLPCQGPRRRHPRQLKTHFADRHAHKRGRRGTQLPHSGRACDVCMAPEAVLIGEPHAQCPHGRDTCAPSPAVEGQLHLQARGQAVEVLFKLGPLVSRHESAGGTSGGGQRRGGFRGAGSCGCVDRAVVGVGGSISGGAGGGVRGSEQGGLLFGQVLSQHLERMHRRAHIVRRRRRMHACACLSAGIAAIDHPDARRLLLKQ
mmetsp:Transcript_66807/g.132423  ORF Transcript_66807/g.132423 Transcript_66807/m.132423 type:complete len:243 (+) Transcript_66807:203-931(+)